MPQDRSRRRGSSAERKRAAAHQHKTGSRLTIYSRADEWFPEEKDTYDFDILAYEVSKPGHPDNVPVGEMWYRRTVKVHPYVGPENVALICPTTIGKKCPICEEVRRLAEDGWDKNKKLINQIRAKTWVAFNVRLANDTKNRVFVFAESKFAELLETELDEGPEKYANFDDPDNGWTLSVRFGEESYEGHSYLKANKIEFGKREPIPDEWLDAVTDLDQIDGVLDYEAIRRIFYGLDESGKPLPPKDGEGAAEETAAEEPRPGRRARREEPEPEKPAEEGGIPEGHSQCVACEGTKVNSKGNPCPICKGLGHTKDKADAPTEKPAEKKAGKPAEKKAPPPEKTEPEKAEGDDWGSVNWDEESK